MDSAQNQNTLEICVCNNRSEQEWSKELDRYYNLLMMILIHKEEKLKLSISQQNWTEYRDTEFSCAGILYSDTGGSMARIAHSSRRLEIVKQRTEELRTYYENLKTLR